MSHKHIFIAVTVILAYLWYSNRTSSTTNPTNASSPGLLK